MKWPLHPLMKLYSKLYRNGPKKLTQIRKMSGYQVNTLNIKCHYDKGILSSIT